MAFVHSVREFGRGTKPATLEHYGWIVLYQPLPHSRMRGFACRQTRDSSRVGVGSVVRVRHEPISVYLLEHEGAVWPQGNRVGFDGI